PDGYACVNDQCILTGTAAPAATCTSALGAGVSHACAIRSDGTAWCWGSNDFGQLGDNTTTDRTSPVQATAPGMPKLTALAGGLEHTCELGAAGTVWCWGHNDKAQLGTGAGETHIPVRIPNLTGATAIVAGDRHACALVNGSVMCWGDNGLGQIGDT